MAKKAKTKSRSKRAQRVGRLSDQARAAIARTKAARAALDKLIASVDDDSDTSPDVDGQPIT